MNRPRLWLCGGPAAFCLLDTGLTLYGQPACYWAGRFTEAVELNPLFRWLLRGHPLWFLAGVLCWLVLLSSLLLCLPARPARAVAFAVLFAHTLGAASWLLRGGGGYVACVVLLVFARRVLDANLPAPCGEPTPPGCPATRPDAEG